MAAPIARAEREEKKWQAYSLSLQGRHHAVIARVLKVSERTIGSYVREAFADVRKQREAQGIPDLDRALAEQDSVIAKCWEQLANTKDNSLNKSAILATISTAYERKHKLLGLLKDKGTLDVNFHLAEELQDLMRTTVRLQYAPPDDRTTA